MSLSADDNYKAHVQNLRAVDLACTQIYRELKRCIVTKQEAASGALLKTFTLLLGAWAEVRLLKLLYEPNGFTEKERVRVLGGPSKLEQWKRSVEVGFRRRYNVPKAKLSAQSLPATAYMRYTEIASLIDDELRPIIEMRNKLAHGQWARALNSDMTEYAPEMMALLNRENALSANFKKSILESISRLVNDLVVGGVAFDRDFDKHYGPLRQTKTNLKTREYSEWKSQMIAKFERGNNERGS